MNRRQFLKQCSVAAAGSAALFASDAIGGAVELVNNSARIRIGKQRYNVLFVLADQWRFCSLGHGLNHDHVVKTPNLDRLAKQGAHWSRCYATHPVCTPNRSTIITGRWPWQTGMNKNDLMLPPTEKCIAHCFTDAGYKCHYIGKWHMDGTAKPGFVPKGWRRRGFTTFEGFNRGHFYFDSPTFTDNGVKMADIGLYTPGTYEPSFQTDLAIKFIQQNKNRPFFCFLSWGPPHTPYSSHPSEFSYNASDIVVRPNVPEGYISAAKNTLKDYFAHCTAMDYEFGRLMKTLDQLGLRDNTLVVFTADHGDMHRSHALTYKGKPEEESWHVPLMMRLPGKIKAGQIVDTLISSGDLMPTILSICGLENPGTCTGKDKSPALNGGSMPDESVYGGVQAAWRAVVKGDYKLVVEPVDGIQTPTKMYNLRTDPYEMNNLVNNPQFDDVKADLLNEIEIWKQKTSDPFPDTPWNAKTFYDV